MAAPGSNTRIQSKTHYQTYCLIGPLCCYCRWLINFQYRQSSLTEHHLYIDDSTTCSQYFMSMNSSEAVIGSVQENASSDDHKEEWHGTVPQASRTVLIRRWIGDEPSAYSQQAPDHKIWFLRKPMSRAKRSMCIEAVRTFGQLGPNQDVKWFASIEDQRFVLGEFKQTYLIETLWIWP